MIKYYLLKTSTAFAYLYIWWLSIEWFLLPLIDLYGFWNWLALFLFLITSSTFTTIAFFIIQKPTRPQATYKETYHV